jgi:8-oxo-dGTP diphosphatase
VEIPPGIAVKCFVVSDGRLLLLKRSKKTKHRPGAWDIPGGRLEPGENPFEGLERETMEETGIKTEMVAPLYVDYFRREDGQQITMIVFLCKARSTDVILSEEHDEYVWKDLKETGFPEFVEPMLKNYRQYFSKA